MLVRSITNEELLETMKLSSLCFEYPFDTKGKTEEELLNDILSDPKEKLHSQFDCQLAVFDENNDFMACMAAIPFTFYFEGKPYSGNGIGNVCTYPHHRKKGAIKAMFIKMLEDSYKNGQVFSYLYPFSEAFYGQFGYHRVSNSMAYELRLQGFPEIKYDGSFHLLSEKKPELLDDFKQAYDIFAKRYNLMVQRQEFDWTIVTDAKAYYNNIYAYLYKDKNGNPTGYMVFKRDGRTLRCRELVFHDFNTLQAIFTFLKSYMADYDILKFHAPSTIHMEHFCKDFSAYPAVMKVTSNGMVRVINVAEVLRNANYKGSGSLCLQITDKYLAHNNGIFTVTYKNGLAIDVSFQQLSESVTADFDIYMPVSTFSAAIVGNYDYRDFEYLEEVIVRSNEKHIQQTFYKKDCFINNYF